MHLFNSKRNIKTHTHVKICLNEYFKSINYPRFKIIFNSMVLCKNKNILTTCNKHYKIIHLYLYWKRLLISTPSTEQHFSLIIQAILLTHCLAWSLCVFLTASYGDRRAMRLDRYTVRCIRSVERFENMNAFGCHNKGSW